MDSFEDLLEEESVCWLFWVLFEVEGEEEHEEIVAMVYVFVI